MLLSLLSGGKDALVSLLLSLPIIIFSLSFHEASHGYVAYRLGDPTARNLGRLTLNPVKHLDLAGTLAMLVFGFGWAKPVPINARNFDNPRIGMALTGIAGPVSNLILGLFNSVFYAAICVIRYLCMTGGSSDGVISVLTVAAIFFELGAFLNFGLMAFNLIPLPPFDGSRFFYLLLPPSWYFKVMRYERTIMIVVLILFLLLSRMGLSPISFIADGLFSLVVNPLIKLGLTIAGVGH